MKNYILGLGFAVLLFSCDTKEKTRLQTKVDSLSVELQANKKVEATLNEVGVMLDSIDAQHKVLRVKMAAGTSYADYITRLRDINTYMQNTQTKLNELEKSKDNEKGVASNTVRRLRTDLDLRSKEIVALQLDIATLREQNRALIANSSRKDSILSSKDEIIRLKNADIASLEGLVSDINDQNRMKVAGLYYAQAQALESAAQRTKFAPRKKKETRREALELYKLALSMGNSEAQARIDILEKELS
jgi:hypothetical protein